MKSIRIGNDITFQKNLKNIQEFLSVFLDISFIVNNFVPSNNKT